MLLSGIVCATLAKSRHIYVVVGHSLCTRNQSGINILLSFIVYATLSQLILAYGINYAIVAHSRICNQWGVHVLYSVIVYGPNSEIRHMYVVVCHSLCTCNQSGINLLLSVRVYATISKIRHTYIVVGHRLCHTCQKQAYICGCWS